MCIVPRANTATTPAPDTAAVANPLSPQFVDALFCQRPAPATACPAKALPPDQRQRLAIHALAATQPIAHLAAQRDVSRKFVYQQADKAQQALHDAFDPDPEDRRVLFHLPVTKTWLHQLTLGLVLIGHSSVRGAHELLRDLFDYPLSVGAIHDVLRRAVPRARARQSACPHRLKPVCAALANQRDDLLAFAEQLDRDLAAVAAEYQVPVALAQEALQVQVLSACDVRRGPREAALRRALRGRCHAVSEAVAAVAAAVVRASSVVENLNSRLRNYFFLRRQLGPDYLALLQFFLKHRRSLRSERPERVGKSPAELLTGSAQAHWLELLGYRRFRRQ